MIAKYARTPLSGGPMRRKLSLITMLFAWLLATGSHWDLVQTFAWARMFVTYSQSMTLSEAVQLTFTPDNLCGMCETVSEAKQKQDTAMPSDGKHVGKILMIFEADSVFVGLAPEPARWSRRDFMVAEKDGEPPPLRPPRILV